MIGLMLVGLIPVAVLGILLGHVVTPDSLAPAVGGTIMLLALLGGAYGFLVAKSGAVFDLIKALPSYWLVQAGKTALGGTGWPAEGWIVIAAWTAVLAPLAVLVLPARYRPGLRRSHPARLGKRGRRGRAGHPG
jgi:ABC-2 type transport system permease protein